MQQSTLLALVIASSAAAAGVAGALSGSLDGREAVFLTAILVAPLIFVPFVFRRGNRLTEPLRISRQPGAARIVPSSPNHLKPMRQRE